MRIFFIVVTFLAMLLLWVSTYMGNFSWTFDLIAHGSLYVIGFIVFHIGVLLVYHARRWAIFFASMLAIYAVCFVFPITIRSTAVDMIPKNPDIFYMNTLYFNANVKPISQAVRMLDPHTVALVEVNPDLVASMRSVYGNPLAYHNDQGLSCAIFSRDSAVSGYVANLIYPVCVARFNEYVLIVTHTVPPYTKELWKEQRRYFDQVKLLINEFVDAGSSVVVVGDMNSTWFSTALRSRFSGYRIDSFLSWWATRYIALPIDHIIPVGIQVKKTYMLPHMTSDHRGLAIFF